MNKFMVNQIIENAINEDITNIDITTDNIVISGERANSYMIMKEDGVIAGLDVAKMVFNRIDESLEVNVLYEDGVYLRSGTRIMEISGSANSILKSERLALNLIQRMSGIATMSRKYSDEVKDFHTRVVDTRKTTPNLRILEKYSVKIGGCQNHRYNLSDAVMIKDNHISVAGSINNAVKLVKDRIPHTCKIEVEVQNKEQLLEAIDAGADIVMLDNMSLEEMKESVSINDGRVILEASGNVTFERLKDIAKTGVDVISCGALTHSFKSLDISLLIEI